MRILKFIMNTHIWVVSFICNNLQIEAILLISKGVENAIPEIDFKVQAIIV